MKYLLLAISAWSLYFYSGTHGIDGSAGVFQTTEDANVFILNRCNVPAKGINFCVHNNWETVYGWSEEGKGVTNEGVEVKLAVAGDKKANGWLDIPSGTYDVTFNLSVPSIRLDTVAESSEPEQKEAKFLRGGDLPMVTYMEDWGTQYKYQNGSAGDVFDVLESLGINLARLRLYHRPGTAVTKSDGQYRTPLMTAKYPNGDGTLYAGEDDILSLAKRAKNHHMAICLSIYLSDFWSGATEQYIPAAWKDVTDVETLGDSVYNYVYRIVSRMVAQGTAPEYVSVGNETNYGILYNTLNGSKVTYGGHTDNIANTVLLFNKAYDAVKAVSPTSQVIIHHSYGDAAKIAICRSFFLNLKNNGGKFDIIGGSYYPHWATNHGATADCTPTGMLEWAADMKTNIGKPVMLMEVGYSWHPYKCEGRNGGQWAGQLELNGCYDEASEAGQEAFIKALHEALDEDDNILGYMYWDPIFVDQQVNGYWIKPCWAEKYSGSGTEWWESGNVISNTTLFDFSGNPLSALYREINSRKAMATDLNGIQSTDRFTDRVQTGKVLKDGQIIIIHNEKAYNLLGACIGQFDAERR